MSTAPTMLDKARTLAEIAAATKAGASLQNACDQYGINLATYRRWAQAYRQGGPAALEPQAGNSGRPRIIEFSAPDIADLQALYLRSNRAEGAGSMTMAAHVLADRHDGLAAVLGSHKSKHTMPVAVREACQRVRPLVGLHREGSRALQNATYAPGLMRLAPCGTRRLYAGEQQSWDDATINFGVCVPWPYGGDKCSDRYDVRLGRFQLLLCHDDATSYVPSWTYVIRPSQGYRGPETGGAILRSARDTYRPDRVVVEGGVWQSKRVLDLFSALDIAWVDAKGRPNTKLVENYFNRLWTRISIEDTAGHLGRYRAEMKADSDLYCACQAGRKDPRAHFPMLADALAIIQRSICWLNTYQVESEHGSWIPQVRFQDDLAAHPHPTISEDWLYLAAPVCEERTVRRGMIECTAEGPFGLPVKWHFSHADLWQHEGQPVRIYFDPLGESPVTARVVLVKPYAGAKAGAILCDAQALDPMTDGTPTGAIEINKSLRAIMRREYTAIMPDPRTGQQRIVRRESEARGSGTRTEISAGSSGFSRGDGGGEVAEVAAPRRMPATAEHEGNAFAARIAADPRIADLEEWEEAHFS